jgi:hypothetical protein
MRMNNIKAILKAALRVALILPFAAVVAFGQQTINLTALPTSTVTPDGTVVPMWGYQCGAVVTGALASCRALNPNAPLLVAATATTPAVYGWSPVVITVPTGQTLTINLTNSLSFTPTGATAANTVPTSLMIVGQLGGGLGTTATATASPVHGTDTNATWSTVAPAPFPFTPPAQGTRVQSFSTEVAAGATAALVFGTATIPLKPGTYLMESGTHPSIQGPMGLYGMLVVTTAPAGTVAGVAYGTPATLTTPATPVVVSYAADVDMLFSEIDANQNKAVDAAVRTAGFSETTVWSGQPGGCGNPLTATRIANPTFNTCYPPAVNYFPTNFAINGVPFNKTNAGGSLFPATAGAVTTGITGNVLVRLVNAGSKMHVPSIVGAVTTPPINPTAVTTPVAVPGFSLVAEDGNLVPGMSRVQSDVFMAAGKTFDVMIDAPAAGSTALPIYDRELSLSANGVGRDGGMIAYIGVNGAVLPVSGAFGAAVANPDSYPSLVPCAATPCPSFTVSDPGKGVLANDVNVYGASLLALPAHGTVTLNQNGTFTYVTTSTGTTATADSFTYCANGSVTGTGATAICSSGLTATVTLGAASVEAASGIVMNNIAYTSNEAAHLKIAPPGPLSVDKDLAGYPLSVVTPITATSGGMTISMDPNGGFNATLATPCTTATATAATATTPAGCTASFTYNAKNSQGTPSTTAATVSITFQAASNLQVTVIDGMSKLALPGTPQDYRWVIQEDRSFYVNPLNTTNTSTTGGTNASTYGVNFHASDMPYVAQGCTGPKSCEGSSAAAVGQTMIDTGAVCTAPGVPAGCSATAGQHIPAVCDVGNGVCRPDTSATYAGKTPVLPGEVYLDPSKRYRVMRPTRSIVRVPLATAWVALRFRSPAPLCLPRQLVPAPLRL